MRKPTRRISGEGQCQQEKQATVAPCGSAGVETTAWIEGTRVKHGKPRPVVAITKRDAREGQARLAGVAERFVVAWKPGNAGRAKGPQFRDNAGRGEGPGHWRKPNIP
jgi:hypothetical protein